MWLWNTDRKSNQALTCGLKAASSAGEMGLVKMSSSFIIPTVTVTLIQHKCAHISLSAMQKSSFVTGFYWKEKKSPSFNYIRSPVAYMNTHTHSHMCSSTHLSPACVTWGKFTVKCKNKRSFLCWKITPWRLSQLSVKTDSHQQVVS